MLNDLARAIASLTRTGNAIVNFSGENLGDPRNQIFFTNAPTLGQWALYNGVGYATYNATLGIVEAAYDNVTRLNSGPKVICSAPQGNIRATTSISTTTPSPNPQARPCSRWERSRSPVPGRAKRPPDKPGKATPLRSSRQRQ
ncbi:MAG: hypothetical protein WCG76_10105 [Verrucomicrobiota bacterium]|jgi:hypothetical protein